MSPLPDGTLIHVPGAFTRGGRAAIAQRASASERITVTAANARRLAANSVCVGRTLVTPGCTDSLRAALEARGYRVIIVPLPAFLRSGGAAFCLTLRLDRQSAASAGEVAEAAVA